jgi:hypothetical protein
MHGRVTRVRLHLSAAVRSLAQAQAESGTATAFVMAAMAEVRAAQRLLREVLCRAQTRRTEDES